MQGEGMRQAEGEWGDGGWGNGRRTERRRETPDRDIALYNAYASKPVEGLCQIQSFCMSCCWLHSLCSLAFTLLFCMCMYVAQRDYGHELVSTILSANGDLVEISK